MRDEGDDAAVVVKLVILGVALIQSACAAGGFLVVGLPGASVWTVVFLIAAVLQAGGLVLIPAVIYEFAVASPTKAIICPGKACRETPRSTVRSTA